MKTNVIATTSTNNIEIQPLPVVLNLNKTETAIDIFLSFQDVSHKTPQTYKRALRQFFNWAKETGRELASLTRADVISFKQHLLTSNYSPNTVNSYLTSIRRFYSFCDLYGIAPNIAKAVKSAKTLNSEEHEKSDFTTNQASDILKASEGNKRDFAIMNILFRCGLRTIEICRANIADVELIGDNYVLKVNGKGDKVRRVPLTGKAWQALNDYLTNERKGAKANEPLFASNAHQCKGGRMATASVSRMAKKYIRSIGINDSKHTAHSCRHTTASMIYEQTQDLNNIQLLLGHADPATTEIYAKQAMQKEYFKHAPNAIIDELI